MCCTLLSSTSWLKLPPKSRDSFAFLGLASAKGETRIVRLRQSESRQFRSRLSLGKRPNVPAQQRMEAMEPIPSTLFFGEAVFRDVEDVKVWGKLQALPLRTMTKVARTVSP